MAALNRTTPAEAETHSDRQAELEALVAQATFKYSVKDYDAAAELYSQATELQAELNGEMASENADLLYAYGRCLYHAAVRNSDVLGSKVAGEKQQAAPEKTSKPRGKQSNSVDTGLADNGMGLTEAGVASTGGGSEASATSEDVQDEAGKPYFQFTGDENFDDSDVESNIQEPEGEAGEGAEEEDDFANAFEVLDLARVLLLKRLQEEEGQEQGKSTGVDNAEETRHLKERLADTHDLQAEISLEGERFPNAADDLRAALALKMELFPQESSLIAEAHYKLSLALEFSSVTQQKTENGESGAGAHIDEAMREEAAKEMEASIASCKLRITKEEADLRARGSTNGGQGAGLGKGKAITQRDIDDVRDMVTDMEQRVSPISHTPTFRPLGI